MKSLKAFAAASCLGVMMFVPASADQWNKRTILTVNEPIAVPGKVLQPGKYVMRLMDSPANRHIVQIFNEREDQLQTTILAIPNYRLQPTGDTEFQWWETPAGQPRAMRAWFYPGDNFGQEFAYPRQEATAIAARTEDRVPTTYAETEADLASARVGTVDRAGTEMELDRETYYPRETQTAQVDTHQQPHTAQPDTTVTQQQRTEQPRHTEMAQTRQTEMPQARETQPAQQQEVYREETRMRTLPRTASNMPLFGMFGFLALGAGMALRAIGSRS